MDFIKLLSDYAEHAKPAGGFFAAAGGTIVIIKGILNLWRDWIAIRGESLELKNKINNKRSKK